VTHSISRKIRSRFLLRGAVTCVLVTALYTLNTPWLCRMDAAEPGLTNNNSSLGTPLGNNATANLTVGQSPMHLRLSVLPENSIQVAGREFSAFPAGTPTTGDHLVGKSLFPFSDLTVRNSPGSGSAVKSSEPKRGIRKGMLALGILGTVGVAAGFVAINEANHNSNCLKTNSNIQSVCNDVHTAGKILIPTSAVVAGLGYIFAFRHAR